MKKSKQPYVVAAEMTLEEIGKELGVTKERVRQIEHEALKKFRKALLKKFKEEDISEGGGGDIMSGGHWNYDGFQMRNHLENIGRDKEVKKRFPKLAKVLLDLSVVMGDIDHELDWDLSCDQMIENDKKFEEESLKKLRSIIKG